MKVGLQSLPSERPLADQHGLGLHELGVCLALRTSPLDTVDVAVECRTPVDCAPGARVSLSSVPSAASVGRVRASGLQQHPTTAPVCVTAIVCVSTCERRASGWLGERVLHGAKGACDQTFNLA